MRILYVVSDQHENFAAAGVSEGALVEPIGHAAVVDSIARGHQAWYYDPQKSWSLWKPLTFSRPDAVVFIHVNGGGSSFAMPLIGVDCSHAQNREWSVRVCQSISGAIQGFKYGGVFTDYQLRGFCFWFYKRLRGLPVPIVPPYRGLRTVIELGNMRNLQQATYLRDNPVTVGRAISRAVAPIDAIVSLPLLQCPPTTKQPYVQIVGNYYADASVAPQLGYYPIIWLQRKLNAHYPDLDPLDIDGKFGNGTATRLAFFQSAHYGIDGKKLEVTGKTDSRTWDKLRTV